jgi:hypothetical protein
MKKFKASTLIQSTVRMYLAKTHYQNTQKHIITIQVAIRKKLHNKLYTDAIKLLMRYGNKTEKEIPEDNYDNSEQTERYELTQECIAKTQECIDQLEEEFQLATRQFQLTARVFQLQASLVQLKAEMKASYIDKCKRSLGSNIKENDSTAGVQQKWDELSNQFNKEVAEFKQYKKNYLNMLELRQSKLSEYEENKRIIEEDRYTTNDVLFNWGMYQTIFNALIQSSTVKQMIEEEKEMFQQQNSKFFNTWLKTGHYLVMTLPKNQNLSKVIGPHLGNCFRPKGQCTNAGIITDVSYRINITAIFGLKPNTNKPDKLLGAIWWYYANKNNTGKHDIVIDWIELLSRKEARETVEGAQKISQLWNAAYDYFSKTIQDATLRISTNANDYLGHKYKVYAPGCPEKDIRKLLLSQIKKPADTSVDDFQKSVTTVTQQINSTAVRMKSQGKKDTETISEEIATILNENSNCKNVKNVSELSHSIVTKTQGCDIYGLPCYLRSKIIDNSLREKKQPEELTSWTHNLASNLTEPDPKRPLFCPTNKKNEESLKINLMEKMKEDESGVQSVLELLIPTIDLEDKGEIPHTYAINLVK